MTRDIFKIVFCGMLLLLPLQIIADSPAGLLKEAAWFSREPFFAGDRITISTVIYNSSAHRMKGVIEFWNDTNRLGGKEFVLNAGGSEIISYPLTVAYGAHSFEARLVEGIFFTVEGKELLLPREMSETARLERFVDLDTDGDGKGDATDPDDDGDGIPDGSDMRPLENDATTTLQNFTLRQKIEEIVPESISGHTLPVIGAIENFRAKQTDGANAMVNRAHSALLPNATTREGDISAAGSTESASGSSWEIWKEGITSKEVIRSPFGYVKLFLALVWQWFMSNAYAFYALFAFLIFVILRWTLRIFS